MRVLVIDDDSIFCEIMKRVGKRRGIEVTTCSVLEEMNRPDTWSFDAAIIDYNLDFVNGLELTEYIRHFGNELPITLVSQTPRLKNTELPLNIKEFICKIRGADEIFARVEGSLHCN